MRTKNVYIEHNLFHGYVGGKNPNKSRVIL